MATLGERGGEGEVGGRTIKIHQKIDCYDLVFPGYDGYLPSRIFVSPILHKIKLCLKF
jgi:hypothetical protein